MEYKIPSAIVFCEYEFQYLASSRLRFDVSRFFKFDFLKDISLHFLHFLPHFPDGVNLSPQSAQFFLKTKHTCFRFRPILFS